MKTVFLLMVVSALLVVSGLAQTPDAGSNTDQATITGCLGGSDGNYTIAEEGSRQILKISTSSVDLKLHLGQDVSLIGHKTSGTASSGSADNSFAVTGLNVISEHCAATAVAPAATAAPPVTTGGPSPGATVSAPAAVAAASTPAASTPAAPASPSASASTPAADATVPAATASPSLATASIPAVDAAAPTETGVPSAATVSTPTAVDGAVPAATVIPSAETVSAPAVDAVSPAANAAPPTRRSSNPRRPLATQTAEATAPSVRPPSETVTPLATEAATPASAASPSSETAVTPAAAAPTPTATHKGGGSLWLMIPFVVLVIALATLAPFLFRWRKRKMLERTDAPNLSLTHEVISDEASSDHDKAEPRKAA
jgi:hypothetical protein